MNVSNNRDMSKRIATIAETLGTGVMPTTISTLGTKGTQATLGYHQQ
jgi:hypothetical protein